MFAIHNYVNSYDVIDYDLLQVSKILKDKMSENMDPLIYLVKMHQNNDTLSEYWPESMSFNYNANSKEANFDISILEGLVVFSNKAYNVLNLLLAPYGEFLKIIVEGDVKYLFNPLVFGEEDLQLSEREYFDNIFVGYKSICFKRDDVDKKIIYKSKLGGALLYCNEEFVDIFKSNNFTGINFTFIPDYIYKNEF